LVPEKRKPPAETKREVITKDGPGDRRGAKAHEVARNGAFFTLFSGVFDDDDVFARGELLAYLCCTSFLKYDHSWTRKYPGLT